MARYHEIEASFWEDLQEYTVEEKILFIYAFSNASTRDSGLYKITIPTILLNTGLTREGFEGALKGLTGKLFYDYENKVMFVAGKLKRRLAGLPRNSNVIKAIHHDLDAFKASSLVTVFKEKYREILKGLGSPPLPLPLPLPKKGVVRGKQKKAKWEDPPLEFQALVKRLAEGKSVK